MFETILLTDENIHEVARKTGRSEVDLHDELMMAHEENRVIFITYTTPEWLEELDWLTHKMAYDAEDFHRKFGLSPQEFMERLREDLEQTHRDRVERMRLLTEKDYVPTYVVLTEDNIERYDLPTHTDISREDLLEMAEDDKKHRRLRTVNLRDPGQWTRAKRREELEANRLRRQT